MAEVVCPHPMAGRRRAARWLGLALATLLVLAVPVADGQPAQGQGCSEATANLCQDRCTLDGQRASHPDCEYECDAATGQCFDRCAGWFAFPALDQDTFDAE